MTIADILIQWGIAYLLGMITILLCFIRYSTWVSDRALAAEWWHDQAQAYYDAAAKAHHDNDNVIDLEVGRAVNKIIAEYRAQVEKHNE